MCLGIALYELLLDYDDLWKSGGVHVTLIDNHNCFYNSTPYLTQSINLVQRYNFSTLQ
jgi:hypothetical protein